MPTLTLEVEHCDACPFLRKDRDYTSDSFEMCFGYYCKQMNDRKIASFVDWHEKVDIPTWCPIIDDKTREARQKDEWGKFQGENI